MQASSPLILASSSRYRRELLDRLGIPFSVVVPDVDESPLPGESPAQLVERLAQAKAAAVAGRHPHAVVIGSDQVVVLDGRIYGKPGTHARAVEQLRLASGRELDFLTAVCVLAPGGQPVGLCTVPTRVGFRRLSLADIENYLAREPALACAGSFQSEGLGVTLCEYMRSDDPTALVGLPLIAVSRLLSAAGYRLP